MSETIYPGSLYDYTSGVFCGVLVTERVMKKLARLQALHLADVKRLLVDEAERGNVFPSMWTLHYPDGEQTSVHFIDTHVTVADRIRTATVASPPKHRSLVFIAGSMDEAKALADAHHEAFPPTPREDTP